MGKLNSRLQELENKILALESKIIDLSKKTDDVRNKPESIVPQLELGKQIPMPSSGTGLGKFPARQGGIFWNDADASATPWGTQPPTATKGYNKHSHGRFSGGALDINTLELVEYDLTGYNKDCQSYWKTQPSIELDEDGNEKISDLSKSMVWDKEEKCWRLIAVYAD